MTMTRWGALAATLGLAITGVSITSAQQGPSSQPAAAASPQGPWIGTWKRNSEKSSSKFPGTSIFKMWPDGEGFRYTMEMTPTSGTPTRMEGAARFDGKPYPEKGNPVADFNAFTRIDDRTYTVIDLKDGKETIRFTVTISADGKTRTSVSRSRNDKGEEVTSVGVWDRVE